MRKLLFFALLFAVGCGSSETVRLRVVPTLGGRNPTFNLQEKISNLVNPSLLNTPTCRQLQVRSAMKIGPDTQGGGNNESINTYLTSVTTNIGTVYDTSTNPLTWAQNNVIFDQPIEFSVPRGQFVQVGIFGSLYEPHDASGTGTCDSDNGTNAYASLTFMGHTIANVGTDGTIPLNVFFFWTRPDVPPTAPTYDANNNITSSGGYYCPTPGSFETCPIKDIQQINTTSATVQGETFAAGINGTPPIKVKLNYSATGTNFYVPSFYPITVDYTGTYAGTANFTDKGTVTDHIETITVDKVH